jgi:hypothetical protein
MSAEDRTKPPKPEGRRPGRPGRRSSRTSEKNNKGFTRTPQVGFTDILDLEDIGNLQKTFAEAFGVASVILDRSGRAITEYVGFSNALNTVARKDGLTFLNCMGPSLIDKSMNSSEPIIEQCPRCGLL